MINQTGGHGREHYSTGTEHWRQTATQKVKILLFSAPTKAVKAVRLVKKPKKPTQVCNTSDLQTSIHCHCHCDS